MGLILGKISDLEQPKYEVLDKKENCEVRKYAPSLIAEVTYVGNHFKNESENGFMTLASYLGVVGKPQNTKPNDEQAGEKIAMTAPVVTQEKRAGEGEKIAMTAPVVTVEKQESGDKKMTTMQFILPSKYTMETIPTPTNKEVFIKETESRVMGVITFSGTTSYSDIEKHSKKLREALDTLGWKITGDYVLARYNPPFTIPFFRTNEVLFPVEK